MFENVLGQPASLQLIEDIEAGYLAQSMLFQGPAVSGKGTSALELGRVISCEAENRAFWSCGCPACSRHRLLIHPDLLCLGPKAFSAEITASSKAFLREEAAAASQKNKIGPARILFIRSIRKLLARFNPVLWEDDPKGGKVFPLAASLEEDLDELASAEPGGLSKLVEGMLKDAYKLESEGIADSIPVGQLRRAAYWSRLAPTGRAKLLVIENADRMQEEARNSLLKILEEPPARFHCVLTSSRPGSLLPTIVSRLRPYRFYTRDAAVEREVIRRVFRAEISPQEAEASTELRSAVPGAGIGTYLESFLPVSGSVLDGLAAFFTASVAYKAVLLAKRQGRPLPAAAVLLGKFAAPKAEEAGLGRPAGEAGELIAKINEKAANFEVRSIFSRFLNSVLEQVSQSLKQGDANLSMEPSSLLPGPMYNEMWIKNINWAGGAVLGYSLRPAQVLEKLFADLSGGMADL